MQFLKLATKIIKAREIRVLCTCLFFCSIARSATVDTVVTYSTAMKKNIKAVVIKPSHYDTTIKYPVIYLLHGYGGNYADWVTKVPSIIKEADNYRFIIVCPDGNVGSWYFDSPIDNHWKYETYVGTELVQWIDKHFSTIKKKSGRAVAGLSMGGHGALYLAINHPSTFGAAGSMSGGVDLTAFPSNWDIALRLGSYEQNIDRWKSYSVINMIYKIKASPPALIIDCGYEDFFFPVNAQLHQKLLAENIPHDYISRPGSHSWEYWKNAIGYQFLFFNNFFRKGQLSSGRG